MSRAVLYWRRQARCRRRIWRRRLLPTVARSLEQSLARRSALTLTVAPRRYMAAVRALADGYDVDVLDVATLVVTSVKAAIVTAGGQWGGLLGWDALERSSAEWLKLQGAVPAGRPA